MRRVAVTDLTGRFPGRRVLAQAARAVLAGEGTALRVHVAVGDDGLLAELNARYRGRRQATDVLAFPLAGGPAAPEPDWEGEVVVNLDAALREAARREVTLEAELALYVVHGVLHLVGYEDRTAPERRRMRAAEAAYLDRLGYPAARLVERG